MDGARFCHDLAVSSDGRRSISWWSTELGDEESDAAARAIRERHLSMGEVTAQFEAQFSQRVGARYAVATTSGTAALVLAYWALDLGSDDEVLVPSGTYIATANAAAVRGVKIRLADMAPGAYTFDAGQVEENLTSATRALAVVHLNGRPADMAAVAEVARRHDLLVVEDAAQALGAHQGGRALGTFGDVGCYSLGVTKLITTGQGGVLVTDRRDVYERARDLRDNFRLSADGRELGLNFKLSDILASVGLVQLGKIDAHRERCLEEYALYRDVLAGADGVAMFDYPDAGGVPLWNEVWVDRRAELVSFLAGLDIETSLVHPPLHTSGPYAATDPFPVTDWHSARALYLPSGPAQRDEDVVRAAEAVARFARGG